PSVIFDSFPNVLLEAGLAGVPVLASQVGGVGEIIHDGETGWLFEPNQWGQASKKLEQLIKDRALLKEAGQRNRIRVQTIFSLDNMVAKYTTLYSNLARNVQ